MFKKLKEKVIDSQTSQRLQQMTQSVSDKFQNMDKEENFFSLTEDDNAISSPTPSSIEPGFSNISLTSTPQDSMNRIRKTSTSSMASDISFLPRYDSVSSIYHLQSDLDISASEMEDNVSTASSQIGHLSKEQIYAAFQKSQMRYHKYRGRFTDLANHYKNLEREFLKLKTELEKTQERSFRRVKELKEQCELEQKAKAHLESSLRIDLDEKQIQINALKEKITLLQSGPNLNVDVEQLTKNFNEVKQENDNLNTANQEMKAKLIILQSKEDEYKEKINKYANDIQKLNENERENNLKLAQIKMELHNELQSKEAELSSLHQENESLKKSLDVYETKGSGNGKVELLQNQNKNLIEKVENLSQKCQTLNNEMLKLEQQKIEIKNLKTKISEEKTAHDQEIIAITKEAQGFKEKLFKEKQEKEDIIHNLEQLMFRDKEMYEKEIANLKNKIEDSKNGTDTIKSEYEAQITKLREDAKKGLLSIEEKMRKKFQDEFEAKEGEMKLECEEKFKLMNSQEEGVKELQIKLLNSEDELKKYEKEMETLQDSLKLKVEKYDELEKSYLDLNKDLTEERGKTSKLEKKLQNLDALEEKVSRLQSNISTLQQENADLSALCEEQKNNIEKLLTEKLNTDNKVKQLQEEFKHVNEENTNMKEDECRDLQLKIATLEKERNMNMHELEGLKEEFLKLSDYNRNDKKRIDEYKIKIEEYKQIIADNEKIQKKLKNDCDVLIEEKNNLKKCLKEANEDLNITKLKLSTKESGDNECKMLEFKLKELREKHEEILKEKDEKIKENLELTRLSENLNEENLKLRNNQIVQQEYENLLEEKERLKHLYEELEEKLKITEMKLENEECNKNECNILLLKLKELQANYDKIIEENKRILEKNSNLERILSEYEGKLKEAEEHLKNTQEELKEFEFIQEKHGSMEMLREKNVELERSLEEKSKKIDEFTTEIEVKIQYIKNLEENYKVLDKNEKDSRKELEKYKNEAEFKSKDLVKLENSFAEIQKLYSTEKKDIMKQVHDLKQVEKNYYSLLDENENLKEQISEIALLQGKLKSLSGVEIEKKKLEENLSELKNNIRILEEDNAESKRKLQSFENLNENFTKSETEKNDLLKEIALLKKICEDKDKEKVDFVNQLGSVNNSLKSIEEKYEVLVKENDALKNATKSEKEEFNLKLQEMQTSFEKVFSEKNELMQKLTKLEEERKVCEDKLEKSVKELETSKHENDSLNSKILKIEVTKKELESMCELLGKEKMEKLAEISKLTENINLINKEKQNLEESFTKVNDVDIKYNRLVSELKEMEGNLHKLKEENEVLKQTNKQVTSDNKHTSEENTNLIGELEELKLTVENYSLSKVELEEKEIKLNNEKAQLSELLEKATQEIEILKKENFELREIKMSTVNSDVDLLDVQQSYYEMKTKYDELNIENKKLKSDLEEFGKNIENFKEERRKYENTINELERHQNELLNEKQLLKEEIEELKISPMNLNSSNGSYNEMLNKQHIKENGLDNQHPDMDQVFEKLTQLKSLDLTNKATIEFYENEVQKLKNNNDKLNRRLDETLVTLHHCSELSHSTELEYLKNVLYNYMLGKEGLVLARVIATVCKFDDDQTEEILKKEQQKQTLLSKLGLL